MKIRNSMLKRVFLCLTIFSMIAVPALYPYFCLIFSVDIILCQRGKIKNSVYFFAELLFVLYALFQVVSGITSNSQLTMSISRSLTLMLLFEYSLFVYLSKDYDIKARIYDICSAGVLALLFTAAAFSPSIIQTGRLTANDKSMSLLGGFVGGHSSTALSMTTAILLAVYWIFLLGENRWRDGIYSVIGVALLFLCGSRKNIVMLVIFFVVKVYHGERKRTIKFLKYFTECMLGIIALYYAVMNIPVLYETWGSRLKNVLDFYITGIVSDGSIGMRAYLISVAQTAYQKKKLFGWGLNTFGYVINPNSYYAHNNFWELLSTGGIVGFVLFYLRYIVLLVPLVSRGKKRENRQIVVPLIALQLLLIVLEWWQISYMYENIMFVQVIMLAYCKLAESRKGKM